MGTIQIVPNVVSGHSSVLLFGAEPESFLTRRLVLVSGRRPRGAELFVGELVVPALAAGTFVSPNVSLWVLARGLLVGLALGVLGALFCVWPILRVPMLGALSRS